MTFQATNLEYWVEGKVQTVFFGNEAEELALLLSNVPDTSNHYLEWNDQSNAHINAVKAVQLTRNDITLELVPEAAAQFGQAFFHVRFDAEEALYKEVAEVLTGIFGQKIKLMGGSVTHKQAAGKDYSTIKYLNLEGKNLRMLPDYVAEMTALETAKLRGNPALDMQEACKVLAMLPGLKTLEFSTQKSIPETLGALSSLESLHIEIDNPDAPCMIPDSISRLQNLRYCFIQTDYELVLPESFASLTALEDCYIRAGKWNLPGQFYQLTQLTQLDFTHSQFTTLPPEMANMPKVDTIIFGSQENRDYQQVMSVIAQMPLVRTIEINFPAIPAEIALCKQIDTLIIWAGTDNPLELPDTLFSMDQLKTLNISLSRITELPDSIGQLKGLKELIIKESVIENLPDAIGNLSALEFLNISENQGLSTLPETLGNLSQLKILYLADNPSLSALPDSMKNLSALESVDIPNHTEMHNIPALWDKLFS
ncbi:MAG: leucine-rich repeat domain-containing protein [Saprospiraceae bacterium]|nr:leucine-rich repeat domain-containing protein [Saprospiraceae bacterium]